MARRYSSILSNLIIKIESLFRLLKIKCFSVFTKSLIILLLWELVSLVVFWIVYLYLRFSLIIALSCLPVANERMIKFTSNCITSDLVDSSFISSERNEVLSVKYIKGGIATIMPQIIHVLEFPLINNHVIIINQTKRIIDVPTEEFNFLPTWLQT